MWTYRTRNDPIAYLHRAGEDNWTWRNDVEACCGANKVEPFDRAMRELKPAAWLRGIRRDQSATRKSRRFVEHSVHHGCHAVSPLLNWSRRDIHQYLKKHDLPVPSAVRAGVRLDRLQPDQLHAPGGRGSGPPRRPLGRLGQGGMRDQHRKQLAGFGEDLSRRPGVSIQSAFRQIVPAIRGTGVSPGSRILRHGRDARATNG